MRTQIFINQAWTDRFLCDGDGCNTGTFLTDGGNPINWYTSRDRLTHYCPDCVIEVADEIQLRNRKIKKGEKDVKTGDPERDATGGSGVA